MTAFRIMPDAGRDAQLALALLLGAAGVALLALAHTRRRDVVPRRAMAGIVALGILAVIATGVLAINGLDAVRLHLSAISVPSATVFLLAAGSALAYLRRRPARHAATPVVLLGLAVMAAGSPRFLDRFGRDPFLRQADSISWRTVDGNGLAEFSVLFYVSDVKLSPTGRAVIVSAFSYDNEEAAAEFHIGRPEARLTRVRAINLVFAGEDRALGVFEDAYESEVREVHVDTPELVNWRQPIPKIANPILTYQPASQRWKVVGDDGRRGVLRVDGAMGSGPVVETRWPSRPEDRWPDAMSVSGDTALVVETVYTTSLLQQSGWPLSFLLPGWRFGSRISTIRDGARQAVTVTPFTVRCVDAPIDDDRLVCSAFDGSRTRLALIDPATAGVSPVTVLPGRFIGTAVSADGWVSGWLGSDAVAIRPSTREGLRVGRPGTDRVSQLSVHNNMVATVSSAGQSTVIRLYAVGDGNHTGQDGISSR